MSAGTDFLRAVLEDRNLAVFQKAHDALFTEEELPIKAFVEQHQRTYGELPSVSVVQENGFALPAIHTGEASPEYRLDRLRGRHVHKQVNALHPQMVTAMRDLNIAGLREVVRSMFLCTQAMPTENSFTTLAEVMDEVIADYLHARTSPGIRGITTGWPTLDELTYGLIPGDLVVIVGRPSLGKSFALNEMAYAAWRDGKAIGYLSLEMTLKQLARRWLARASGINSLSLRSGETGTYGHQKVLAAAQGIQDTITNVYLMNQMSQMNVPGISSFVGETQCDAVYIDSAYLMQSVSAKTRNWSKTEQLAQNIHDIRNLMLDRNLPGIITVQFNRNMKSDSTRDPDLGDIGGTDALGQDAGIVLALLKGQAPLQTVRRRVVVLKNRDGETGEFATAFSFHPPSMHEVEMLDENTLEEQSTPGGWAL